MQRVLCYSVALILLGILAASPPDARGDGGAGGGHGGVASSFSRNSVVIRTHNGTFVRLGHRNMRHFPHGPFASRLGRNDFGGLPVTWGWPGDWWWPDNYQSLQQPQEAPAQPEIIVIHTDHQSQMLTAEATPDFSYVKGCHAIPNGYHCDAPTQ